MAENKFTQKIDLWWETPSIGTFVETPTINIGVVSGSLGMFAVIMLRDGTVAVQPNTSCRVLSAPVPWYNKSMMPNTLVYIVAGRFMGTYGRILGAVCGILYLKPEKITLSAYLQVAGQFERRVFVVNQTDVQIV